jgi:hypothetical protein
MRFGKFSLAAIAAASLLSAPVMAQSASAASKSVGVSKVKRAGAASKDESKQAGSGVIVAIVAAVAVIGGIVLAAGNDDDGPTSP